MARKTPAQPTSNETDRDEDRQRWLRRIERALDELKGTESPTTQALLSA